ncbi:hypothetical protein KM043_010956 [Ampulex compressa]|nr:hypothetical protein KM043_010956 [Ampulex compressa]
MRDLNSSPGSTGPARFFFRSRGLSRAPIRPGRENQMARRLITESAGPLVNETGFSNITAVAIHLEETGGDCLVSGIFSKNEVTPRTPPALPPVNLLIKHPTLSLVGHAFADSASGAPANRRVYFRRTEPTGRGSVLLLSEPFVLGGHKKKRTHLLRTPETTLYRVAFEAPSYQGAFALSSSYPPLSLPLYAEGPGLRCAEKGIARRRKFLVDFSTDRTAGWIDAPYAARI